jgi:branched-subunit amino acid aminotransferase/4-amino-4-deoxychorismate lyase
MFLTGTGAEVIPVTLIDKRPVGDGKPGPVTRQLIGAFRALIAKGVPEN